MSQIEDIEEGLEKLDEILKDLKGV